MRARAACLALALAGAAHAWPARPPVPAQFGDRALFDAAYAAAARAADAPAAPGTLAALVVPHHLLAADLIARGFAVAAAQVPARIVLLGPDHYHRGTRLVSVNLRDFSTCFGTVPADLAGAAALLAERDTSSSNLFARDHAFGAVVPFIARQWPGVPVLAVAIGATARADTWQRLAHRLAPLTGPGTLIVQSSDFSHYLPTAAADACDRRTVAVIDAGDPAAVGTLHQPHHTDCRGALYVTLALTGRRRIVARRNSSVYAGHPVLSSTSYLVIACLRKAARTPRAPTAARPPAPR